MQREVRCRPGGKDPSLAQRKICDFDYRPSLIIWVFNLFDRVTQIQIS